MSFVILSINHALADLDLRVRVAFTPEKLETAYRFAKSLGLSQLMILSTCNRVELIAQLKNGQEEALLYQFLSEFHQIPLRQLLAMSFLFHNDQAVEHLIRLGAGLESMVMGEPQILGQLKDAYALARGQGAVSRKMYFIMEHVLQAAKRIRHETAIGHCPVSVAFSSVQLVKSFLNQDTRILVLGAGATARLVAKHLLAHAPKEITIANRTIAHAEVLMDGLAEVASATKLQCCSLAQAKQIASSVDLIIGTTQSLEPILVSADLQGKHKHPISIVDLAVPRDVEAEIGKLPAVTLYSIDDIRQTIQQNTLQRTQAAVQAHHIIQEELQQFRDKCYLKDCTRELVSFRERIYALKQSAVHQAKRKLARGDSPEQVLEHFANILTNRLLHEPSFKLHQSDLETKSKIVSSLQLLWGDDLTVQ